jgi:hypothetical protein
MAEKNFLQDLLSKLSIKVEKVGFEVSNVSLDLNEKFTTVESVDFTVSNIYKGDTLITPKINMSASSINIPLEDIYPLIEEKLKGSKKEKKEEKEDNILQA